MAHVRPIRLVYGRAVDGLDYPIKVDTDGIVQVSGGGGGGGGDASAANQVITNTSIGPTTAVAVAGDNNGSLSAKLRNINIAVSDVYDSVGHVLKVSDQNATRAVTQSGSWVLSAGSAIIGKTGIDQTTPGTTNKVTVGADVVHVIVDSGVTSGGLTDAELRATPVPISGTVTANAGTDLNTSALATSAKQSDGSQKTQIVDGSGNVIGATSNALDVNIKSGAGSGGTALADEAAFSLASTSVTPIAGVYNSTPDTLTTGKAGALQMTAARGLHSHLVDAAGATISTLPVSLATVPALVAGTANIGDVDVASIAAGDNNIGNVDIVSLPALVAGSANIGDVDVLTVPSDPFGVNADAASATGSISAKLRFIAATGIPITSGTITTVSTVTAVTAISNALPAGTNAIGKLAANSGVDIGDVDVTSVPADPFGVNADAASATGSISAKLRFIAATGIPITGTVTVGSHAVTNAGVFVVQENGAALTALQLIDDTVATLGTTTYTEASTKGLVMGAVRRDADTTMVDTTNEVAPLQVNATGALKVAVLSGTGLLTDEAAFTTTSTSVIPIAGIYNSSPDTLTTGKAGALQMTAARGLHVHLVDGAGANIATLPVSLATLPALVAGTANIGDVDVLSAKIEYAASSALTIGLGSLGASATWVAGRESDSYDNSSNKYPTVGLSGTVMTGTTPTAGEIRVYVVPALNDTPTWPDVFDGTDSAETVTSAAILDACGVLAARMVTNTTSNQAYPFRCVDVASLFGGFMPKRFVVFIAHSTVAALHATAGNHVITVTPMLG